PAVGDVSIFFFQAEDGIRAFHVTGVQTCALPICSACGFPTRTAPRWPRKSTARPIRSARLGGAAMAGERCPAYGTKFCDAWRFRSEERRVGEQARGRGGAERENTRKAAKRARERR